MNFEALVLRVWKGMFFGATAETIMQQLESENISPTLIKAAIAKAERSPTIVLRRSGDVRISE